MTRKNVFQVYKSSGYIGNKKACTGCGNCGQYDDPENEELEIEPLLPSIAEQGEKSSYEKFQDEMDRAGHLTPWGPELTRTVKPDNN